MEKGIKSEHSRLECRMRLQAPLALLMYKQGFSPLWGLLAPGGNPKAKLGFSS